MFPGHLSRASTDRRQKDLDAWTTPSDFVSVRSISARLHERIREIAKNFGICPVMPAQLDGVGGHRRRHTEWSNQRRARGAATIAAGEAAPGNRERDLSPGRAYFARDDALPRMICPFVVDLAGDGIAMAVPCRVPGVSTSGVSEWHSRPASPPSITDQCRATPPAISKDVAHNHPNVNPGSPQFADHHVSHRQRFLGKRGRKRQVSSAAAVALKGALRSDAPRPAFAGLSRFLLHPSSPRLMWP